MDGEIVDHLNAVNDDCVAAIHDWASLTAAMWPCTTPRESNEMQEEEDSEYNSAAIRESTPERALRKMEKKVRKLHARAARRELSRIVTKDVGDSDFPQPQASDMSEASDSPASRTQYATKALYSEALAHELRGPDVSVVSQAKRGAVTTPSVEPVSELVADGIVEPSAEAHSAEFADPLGQQALAIDALLPHLVISLRNIFDRVVLRARTAAELRARTDQERHLRIDEMHFCSVVKKLLDHGVAISYVQNVLDTETGYNDEQKIIFKEWVLLAVFQAGYGGEYVQRDPSSAQAVMTQGVKSEEAVGHSMSAEFADATRAARGEYSRIVAKDVGDSDFPQPQANQMSEGSYSPALRTLDDPSSLQYVIEAFEYLSSIRLHYCRNCDEEWPVFDGDWPQSGVAWAGPKAGSCECIKQAGFLASDKDDNLCHRCDGPSAYKTMYSKDNLQHLGERHPALSALTWYEALLIARVHPVRSVITLTPTGHMCYTGYVCNYYQKDMEWVHSLPAVEQDKKWFLIKCRGSISAVATGIRQKKPTTANRRRLEAGIKEATKFLPTVYKYSKISQDELNRFPAHGEQEMLDPEEVVDLKGQVYITQEMFGKWFQKGVDWAKWPCAGTVHRYVVHTQGLDLRGSVADDTAWEMCCRLLMLSTAQNKLSTADLAQLLVYWLEDRQVPAQMGDIVYEGMVEELASRGERVETYADCVHGSLHGSSHGYI